MANGIDLTQAERDLPILKKRYSEYRDTYIQAQAIYSEVNKKIQSQIDQLKELGVEGSDAEECLTKIEEKLTEMSENIKSIYDDIKNKDSFYQGIVAKLRG
jgi:DNA repair exonuclease SbcCD ATPase subunit